MRKFACLLGAVIVASMSLNAVAQTSSSNGSNDSSKVSVFGGYSYLYYSNGTDSALYGNSQQDVTANANGLVVSAAYNFADIFAVVGEYGVYHASSLSNVVTAPGVSATLNMQTYLIGPKISSSSNSPIKPFVQILIGGASGTFKASGGGNSVTGPRANSFAMALGGGLDWKINRHFSIRPAQFEYLMTRFTSSNTSADSNAGTVRLGDLGNGTQNNLRYSAGVVYNF